MYNKAKRTTTFIYQVMDENDGPITIYSNTLPRWPNNIISGTIQIRTPYEDINGVPIYTGDVVKHYNGMDLVWAYDIGVVYKDDVAGCFRRTSLLPESVSVNLNEKCHYLVLGDLNDSPAAIAVELWKTLHQDQCEMYYYDNGIIGFLEEFRLTQDSEPLSTQEIEWALDEIEKYNDELRHIEEINHE